MEMNSTLVALELSASDPRTLARFYAATFKLEATGDADTWTCVAPGRRLVFVAGPPGQLRMATFRFHDRGAFDAHRSALAERGIDVTDDDPGAYRVHDPHGHAIRFIAPEAGELRDPLTSDARLQHFALRARTPAALADFYVDRLGFVVSDRVHDDQGDLTAIFLRTDAEHHAIALFRSPEPRFDHFSCEVADWAHLRDWADHMASVGVDLAWGIGRHGPGNDTFLMVRDIDGNMGEISAELEVCQPGRPAGAWPHRPQTLNQWGVAIMRS